MKLTDNEKREILKLIEADKPLPDKYRFMLFDDKREVELVWNGNKISIISREQEDYISLTDIAKYRNKQEPFAINNNWMRNRSTIEFLGLWEKLSNPDFKPLEFERFKSEAGSNYFVLLTKINYRIHTEAISENLGPAELSK